VGTCYRYPHATIGDIDLVLGYLNPDYFLGGKVRLDKKAALEALEEQVAKPLGEDVYKASSSILELLHSNLKDHISASVLSKGHRTEEYVLLIYGGSGPLHLWGVEEGLKFSAVCTCPWAAAFSAFGVAASDYFYRYQKTVMCVLPSILPDDLKLAVAAPLSEGWKELENQAIAEFKRIGIPREQVRFSYGILARYLGQMFSWEAPVEKGRIESIDDVNNLIKAFENTYLSIYPLAARMPEAGYAITDLVCEAKIEAIRPVIAEYPLGGETPPKKAYKGQREVFHKGSWIQFNIWEMDLIEAGNKVQGPAIIEHPMTTLVVPPKTYIEVDHNKLLWLKRG
jgi:N-methylhydantoinase A